MKLLLAPLALSLAGLAAPAAAQIPVVQRLDLDPAGLAPNDGVTQVTISADGSHVAFLSQATNLVSGQVGASGQWNLFVREVRTGTTVQANLDSTGAAMLLNSTTGLLAEPTMALSGDGSKVVFTTTSGDPVIGDMNFEEDVYLRDLTTGRTELISVGMTGPTASDSASYPSISDDGRFVSFQGVGGEFAPLPGIGIFFTAQSYVRDRQAGHTAVITRPGPFPFATGDQAAATVLSGDGSLLVMLLVTASDSQRHLVTHERGTGKRTDYGVVSMATVFSGVPTLSVDRTGERIVFSSELDGIVAGDTDGGFDVFLLERSTGVISKVNLATDGSEASSEARNGCISPDGRYVSFESYGDELFPGPGAQDYHVFVRDLETGLTTLGSLNGQAVPGTGGTFSHYASTFTSRALSEGGRHLVYHSSFTNLTGTSTPGDDGAYLLDRRTGGAGLSIAGLTAGGTATLTVERATASGVVLVGLSVAGQGPLPSTWGILDVSPPLHTHHMSVDAAGAGTLAFSTAGLPVGQALFAQGVDLSSGLLTTAFHGIVQ